MSYILDALRRADAERQQGQVPGLHAAPAADLPPVQQAAWRPLAVGLAGAVLVAAAGLALLLFWRAGPAPGPAAAPTAATVAQAASQAVVPSPPPMAAATPAAPPALPIVVSAAPAAPGPAEIPAVPRMAAPPPAVVPAGPAAATPAARAVPLSSLPPEERRQLPALVPGGSVWSDSAASRFVILDGQVLREGDAVATGVVLERIERKAAVLRWKDQRLEVPL